MAFHTIEKVAEKEQVGHFYGADGDPAHDFGGEDQWQVDKDTVFEARRCKLLQRELDRAQDQEHDEVDFFEHDVGERKGRNERRAAK